jgi:hypothetical protein
MLALSTFQALYRGLRQDRENIHRPAHRHCRWWTSRVDRSNMPKCAAEFRFMCGDHRQSADLWGFRGLRRLRQEARPASTQTLGNTSVEPGSDYLR